MGSFSVELPWFFLGEPCSLNTDFEPRKPFPLGFRAGASCAGLLCWSASRAAGAPAGAALSGAAEGAFLLACVACSSAAGAACLACWEPAWLLVPATGGGKGSKVLSGSAVSAMPVC